MDCASESEEEEEAGEEPDVKRPRQIDPPSSDRCIALLDMDCFYVAVERELNPSLLGQPVAVAQYTAGASLVAVSYEAKALGVKRGMLSQDAKRQFPSLQICRIETKNGKADLNKYRSASDRVIALVQRFCLQIEKASVDEFYLDLTNLVGQSEEVDEENLGLQQTLVCIKHDTVATLEDGLEYCNKLLSPYMQHACKAVWTIRQAIKRELGFECSAGISSNRFLAKSIAGMRKPFTQIVLPHEHVRAYCDTLPLSEAKSLGGKKGRYLAQEFGLSFLGQLGTDVKSAKLCEIFGSKEGRRLALLGAGEDATPVTRATMAKSMGASKQFAGKTALRTRAQVNFWMDKLVLEIIERLQADGRRPSTIIVGIWGLGSRSTSTFAPPLSVHSLNGICKTLLDRLLESQGVELEIHSLSLTLAGFPEEEGEERGGEEDKRVAGQQHQGAKWTCKTCTLENDSEWLRCEACGSDKLGIQQQRQQSTATARTWTCAHCTFADNDRRFLRCEVCAKSKA